MEMRHVLVRRFPVIRQDPVAAAGDALLSRDASDRAQKGGEFGLRRGFREIVGRDVFPLGIKTI